MNDSCHRHDISDKLWDKLEPLIIGTSRTPGVIGKDNRKFVNAVFWILRTGAPWRDLPESYGDWKNTHRRFCRWRDKGVWESILKALTCEAECELVDDRRKFCERAHQHAHGAVGRNQDIGLSKGGEIPKFILPWIRMAVRSESLLLQVQSMIVQKLLI